MSDYYDCNYPGCSDDATEAKEEADALRAQVAELAAALEWTRDLLMQEPLVRGPDVAARIITRHNNALAKVSP